VKATVPASSANLGPGFDALGLALGLYISVSVELSDALQVSSSGEGAGLFDDERHLAVKVAKEVVGHDRLAIHVESEIPLARGLGSSAALAVAAAAAAGSPDPLAVAAKIDGHPENAAASVLGGLVGATTLGSRVRAARLALDPDLQFVVFIPDHELRTEDARSVLPETYSRQDVAFNLGRMALLLGGLGDHRLLTPQAMEDRLHQPYRLALFPQSQAIMDAAVEAGALGACWSGAGPSLIAVTLASTTGPVLAAMQASQEQLSVPGSVRALEADHVGLQLDSAR
jgi:homoserine kinase